MIPALPDDEIQVLVKPNGLTMRHAPSGMEVYFSGREFSGKKLAAMRRIVETGVFEWAAAESGYEYPTLQLPA